MAAAEVSEGKKVIGVDVDQYAESYTVVTSAMKMLGNAVYDALGTVYNNTFVGGKTTTMDVNNNGVGIAMDNVRFEKFTKDDYKALYDQALSNKVKIKVDESKTLTQLKFKHVTVHFDPMVQ